MAVGLYSGVSGLALGTGLYKDVSGLWGGASGLINGFGGSDPFSGASLYLNFLAGAPLDSRVTFTRSTTATFVGSDGLIQTAAIDAPRFDYDPVTLSAKGLLTEEQRTNLLLQSQTFGTSPWFTNNATITVNTTVAPDGTTTASKLVEDTTNNFHRVGQVPTLTAVSHTATIYAKPAGRNWIYIANASLSQAAYFNVSTGVIGTVVGATTATIAPAGNGWYRCSITSTPSAAAQNYSFYTANADLSFSYTGDGTSGLFIWGAQLETGPFATSYIPTGESQVTRTVDVPSMTGTNFSSWYNQSEGTLLSSVLAGPVSPTDSQAAIFVTDATATNLINIRRNTAFNVASLLQTSGGLGAGLVPVAPTASNVVYKNATAYALNNARSATNGTLSGLDTNVSTPPVDRLFIGVNSTGTSVCNGHIRQIVYYNTRLSDAQLQALTEPSLITTLSLDFINGIYDA